MAQFSFSCTKGLSSLYLQSPASFCSNTSSLLALEQRGLWVLPPVSVVPVCNPSFQPSPCLSTCSVQRTPQNHATSIFGLSILAFVAQLKVIYHEVVCVLVHPLMQVFGSVQLQNPIRELPFLGSIETLKQTYHSQFC